MRQLAGDLFVTVSGRSFVLFLVGFHCAATIPETFFLKFMACLPRHSLLQNFIAPTAKTKVRVPTNGSGRSQLSSDLLHTGRLTGPHPALSITWN